MISRQVLIPLLSALLYTGCVDASAAEQKTPPMRQIWNVVRVFMNYVDEYEVRYTFLTEERFAGDALRWQHHYYRINTANYCDTERRNEVVFYPDVPRSSQYLWVDAHLCSGHTMNSDHEYWDVYKLGIHVRSPEDVSGGGWDTGGKHPVRNQTNVVQ